jgi:cytochrome c peroxidase
MSRKSLGPLVVSIIMLFGVMNLSAIGNADDGPGSDLISLGKALFFDKNLSAPDGQACASCHNPYTGFAD